MYSTLFTTTLFFALAVLRVRAEFEVDTIGLTQCQPATLNWASTQGPYNVIIVPSSNPCGDAIVDLGDLDTNQLQWSKVNIPAGTQVTISVMDGNDDEGWSGSITVASSDDNSCLTSQGNTPAASSPPPPQVPASTPPSPSPSTTLSESPNVTPVGASNSGKLSGGASMLHFSGGAVAVTVLGALAALL